MKVIVQQVPDEVDAILYDLNLDDFIVDADTYVHFFKEVFLKGIEDYIKKKHKIKFKDTENVEDTMKLANMYDNQKCILRYWPKYNKIRGKFYLYQGNIYSYEFIGFYNVGHVIEIYKYDMTDLCNMCNELQKKKRRPFKRQKTDKDNN
jgi:hypothetical protein